METACYLIIPLLAGYVLDLLLGDPESFPHPVRLFGNLIALAERWFNRGGNRFLKGALSAITLCAATYFAFVFLLRLMLFLHPVAYLVTSSIFVFFGLANRSLLSEGRKVFDALEHRGTEAGRRQLSCIVGRDTASLTPQQIRIAVLETLSENLSDGVIAPLFFYALAGVPGMMLYKMINTLDSMTGYRSERYEQYGKFAARLDDVANLLPARITALLMVLVGLSPHGLSFVVRYGHRHKSPNAGYPEAALAGILQVRFGGPNRYHGVLVSKPYIGLDDREVHHGDFRKASRINHGTCLLAVILVAFFLWQSPQNLLPWPH